MGSFNNTGISGLWIGGKSVRRASLGGKVFFEKHDYDFSLTSNKSILSHADNESATLTATLTDYNEPVSGETVIFTADTPFKTNVINDTGTYDFGDYVTIDLSNFKNIDSLSTGADGHLKIGSSSTYLNIWGRAFNNYIFCDYYRNGSEINSVQVSLNHPLIIRDGVLYCKKYIGNDELRDYTLDVSDVDLTEWAFSGKVIGVDVTVDEYWWASDVTDSNGEATVGYVSKGAGDLNIKVECMNLQETYSIQDGLFYDASSSSNVSKYTISSANWSYDNTEQAYKIFNTSRTWADGTITGLTVPTDVEISFDVKIPYNNNGFYNQLIFGLKNSNGSNNISGRILLNHSIWNYQIMCGKKLNGTETWTTTVDSTTNYNNWVKLVISIKNGSLTVKLLDNNTVVATDTLSVSDITLGDSNSIKINSIFNSSQGFYMKNILIKPL